MSKKKVTAYYKSINPFLLDPRKLGYTKTVEVDDDVDMDWLEEAAKQDTQTGYRFDRLEVINEKEV